MQQKGGTFYTERKQTDLTYKIDEQSTNVSFSFSRKSSKIFYLKLHQDDPFNVIHCLKFLMNFPALTLYEFMLAVYTKTCRLVAFSSIIQWEIWIIRQFDEI